MSKKKRKNVKRRNVNNNTHIKAQVKYDNKIRIMQTWLRIMVLLLAFVMIIGIIVMPLMSIYK